MPSDYPLIATKIIGSSGSSTGYNSLFVVDNVQWEELPGLSTSAVPEPGTWLLLCSGLFLLACARGGSGTPQGRQRSPKLADPIRLDRRRQSAGKSR